MEKALVEFLQKLYEEVNSERNKLVFSPAFILGQTDSLQRVYAFVQEQVKTKAKESEESEDKKN